MKIWQRRSGLAFYKIQTETKIQNIPKLEVIRFVARWAKIATDRSLSFSSLITHLSSKEWIIHRTHSNHHISRGLTADAFGDSFLYAFSKCCSLTHLSDFFGDDERPWGTVFWCSKHIQSGLGRSARTQHRRFCSNCWALSKIARPRWADCEISRWKESRSQPWPRLLLWYRD